MDGVLDLITGQFILLILVLVRVSGLSLVAPIYGGTEVPAQVRILLAVMLAVLLAPTQAHVSIPEPQSVIELLLLVAAELLIGVTLGWGVMVLLAGIQLAGQIIGQTSGMTLAEVFNPGLDTSVPLFSQLLYWLTLAVFVAIGGHRMVLGALLTTFELLPPGAALLPTSIAEMVVNLLTQSFELGIRAAAPATVALLVATLVLGLISRTLPQLNVLALGFGVNAIVTMLTLAVSLASIVWLFEEQLEPALQSVLSMIDSSE